MIVGDKLHLKCKDVKVCRVPHLKGLTVDDLLKFGIEKANIMDYLPEYEYKKLPNRQWLCNVLHTLLGDTFTKFVQDKIKDRVKLVIRKKELNVKALPEFVEIFNKSQNISVQKGRSHYLLKRCGKRKWDQMEDDNREQLKRANIMISDLNKEFQKMEFEIQLYKEMEDKYIDNKAILERLYNDKVIDSDGEQKS